MANLAVGQPLPEAAQLGNLNLITNTKSYNQVVHTPLTLKPLTYLHGESRVIWEEKVISQMIVNEELKYAVVEKLSYG